MFLKEDLKYQRSPLRFGTIEKELEEPEEVMSSSWTLAFELGRSRQERPAKY